MAGYPLQLADDGIRLYVGTKGKTDKPADRLCLACSTSSGLSHMRKQLEEMAVLICIDRNIDIAAPGCHVPCLALDRLRPFPRYDFLSDRLGFLVRFAGREHLLLP